ncbi:MAG: pyruvate formate lyase-activating protein [Dehalococcoidia bacterium]|nr:pyruvate formate lyase-activating protein [Dehalococcoidia bacterium]
MRILAVDIGTGTQDILLFNSKMIMENCPKLVMPSATAMVARKVEEATRRGEPLLLTGTTMGGGPSVWAVEAHLRAGYAAYATPAAALTFDDHMENVAAMGITVVSADEAKAMRGAATVEMGDLDLAAVATALEAFGVEPRYDGVAVAVFDHGAAPIDVSDRTFRFDYLKQVLSNDSDLSAFGHLASEIPPHLTRMRAVARRYSALMDAPLLLLDTAPAGALGSLGDAAVANHEERLLINLGNMHATAFRLRGDRVLSLFEHHTGLVGPTKLEELVGRLVAGTITNGEVFDSHGHGACVLEPSSSGPFIAVTGPRRSMLRASKLAPHFAVPWGDMMLSGCFGLVRAFGYKNPEWREAIDTIFTI